MGLSGSLEDISILDVLQILGMSGKSGVLHVEQGERQIEIGFTNGMVVAANLRPRKFYLTDLLIQRGMISATALEHLREEDKTKPVGDLLLSAGKLTVKQIEEIVVESIQRVFSDITTWTDGNFSFELGEATPPVDRLFLSEGVKLGVRLSPQELLMEAARIHDEVQAGKIPEPASAGRRKEEIPEEAFAANWENGGEPASPEPAEEEPARQVLDEEGEETTLPVILLTANDGLRRTLEEALQPQMIAVHVASTFENARHLLAMLGSERPLLVLDTDTLPADIEHDGPGVQALLQQRRESGKVPIVTFGSGRNPQLMAGLLTTGEVTHVPTPIGAEQNTPAMDLFLSKLTRTIVQQLFREGAEEKIEAVATGVMGYADSLYHAMLDLRRNYHSVTISLDVLRFVADYLDRAILFLVEGDRLVALGGFGVQSLKDPNAKKLPKIHLPIREGSSAQEVVQTKTVFTLNDTDKDEAWQKLFEVIGPPARFEAMLIPIVVADKVSSVIYADNGRQNIGLCSPEPLGILVEHAGLLLEIMLLRRKLEQLQEA